MVRNYNFFNFVIEHIIYRLAETLKLLLQSFLFLFLILTLIKFESLIGCRDKLLPLKLFQVPQYILINGVNHEQKFITFLLQVFKKLRTLHSFLAFSHDIIPKTGQLISALSGVVVKPFSKLTFVLGILDLFTLSGCFQSIFLR